MAFINMFGGGGLQSNASGGWDQVNQPQTNIGGTGAFRAGVPTQDPEPFVPTGSQGPGAGSPVDMWGNFNPAFAFQQQQALLNQIPNLAQGGSAGGAGMPGSVQNPAQPTQPAQPNFGGLAATPGGSMTFDGKQYTAQNGQWVPTQSGMQDPMAGGGAWNSGIPGLSAGGFQGQAGGQDMLGSYTLNNRNFVSLEDANALAKALGANVVTTNYEDGSRTPEYNLDFGRGSPLNAGQLAYYFGPNSSFAGIRNEADRIAAIKRSIEDELRYNDSGMERQVADKRDQFSSFKNTPGGYSSGVSTGSGAPSLSDTSFWQNTEPLPWQAAAGPASQPGMANGLPGAPGTAGGNQPTSNNPNSSLPPTQGGGQAPGRTQNPFSMFNMSPNMNSLYYLNQRPNQQLGGLGMMGQNGQFSPLGAAGFGGFGNQMPFTMGGMPGFMGMQNQGLVSNTNFNSPQYDAQRNQIQQFLNQFGTGQGTMGGTGINSNVNYNSPQFNSDRARIEQMLGIGGGQDPLAGGAGGFQAFIQALLGAMGPWR